VQHQRLRKLSNWGKISQERLAKVARHPEVDRSLARVEQRELVFRHKPYVIGWPQFSAQ
jgi:hypothetical protein